MRRYSAQSPQLSSLGRRRSEISLPQTVASGSRRGRSRLFASRAKQPASGLSRDKVRDKVRAKGRNESVGHMQTSMPAVGQTVPDRRPQLRCISICSKYLVPRSRMGSRELLCAAKANVVEAQICSRNAALRPANIVGAVVETTTAKYSLGTIRRATWVGVVATCDPLPDITRHVFEACGRISG